MASKQVRDYLICFPVTLSLTEHGRSWVNFAKYDSYSPNVVKLLTWYPVGRRENFFREEDRCYGGIQGLRARCGTSPPGSRTVTETRSTQASTILIRPFTQTLCCVGGILEVFREKEGD